MANEEHLKLLKQGVHVWNTWREANPEVQPDLSGANLKGDNRLARVNYSRANLQDADLTNTILEGADLREANLQQAHFAQANLRDADLCGADLHEAILAATDFQGAIFRGANLAGTDLKSSKGLSSRQLGGANLTGVVLSEAVAKFEGLALVEELSKSAKRLFTSMLLACVYCWLTIATTTDARLLTNSASSPLPVIQTAIPIVGFYVAAPLILLCLYFYFHFYMQRLWEALADLPAFFPDGAPLDKKCYPWLLNGMVQSYFALLKKVSPPLSRLQSTLSVLLAWWVVPLTLVLFWLRYLFRHDLRITLVHIFLIVVMVGAAFGLHRLAAATLRGKERRRFAWRDTFRDVRTRRRAAALVGMAAIFAILWWFSRKALTGEEFTYYTRTVVENGKPEPRPSTFSFRADLVNADISMKPENWTGLEADAKAQIPLVKGAQLEGANLRFANASGAFFIKANLGDSNFQGANLYSANLQEAILFKANLQGADLPVTNLQGTNLSGANLRGADLLGANLRGAHLLGAELQGAQLIGANFQVADLADANLQGANLSRANLQEADLSGAKLQGAQLLNANLQGADLNNAAGLITEQAGRAQNWQLAYYSEDLCKKLGLPSNHNDVLRDALETKDPKEREKKLQKIKAAAK